MKAKAISILLVIILTMLAGLYLDDFAVSNSTAEASLLPERSGRTYSEAETVNITVDGLTLRLFERKIRECTPLGFDDKGVRLGLPTKELFECVYESLGWKTLEKYDRQQCDAMTDIALDSLVEKSRIEYDYENEQWVNRHTSEYKTKHWR